MRNLRSLPTEQPHSGSSDIDTLDTLAVLKMINAEDKGVAHAVEKELLYISQAVDLIVEALKRGGRLIYVGAGTSGRLGILDASECPPTFGTDPDTVIGLIAGGERAVFRSQEGAEDDEVRASTDLQAVSLSPGDVVCGIAASIRTPYVVSAVDYARQQGAKTIFITTNSRVHCNVQVDVAICPNVGSEIIMGSTRMKSGTAQKLVLNMLTTATMIRLGKVYRNMMVDLQLTNKKLRDRATRILCNTTGVLDDKAEEALTAANGHVKTAIVMITLNVDVDEARRRLAEADGFVRRALSAPKSGSPNS